jgi:hypothetical protein
MSLVVRAATYLGAFVLMAHGLVFLIFLLGAPAYPSGRLEWSGRALVQPDASWSTGVGRALVVASIALYIASAAALVFGPRQTVWAWLCLAAGVVSLAAFAWIWPGLLPTPGTYWRGVVLSAVAMVPAGLVIFRS